VDPTTSINIISNNYGYVKRLRHPRRTRSTRQQLGKYYDAITNSTDGFSFTGDAGWKAGSGVAAPGRPITKSSHPPPPQSARTTRSELSGLDALQPVWFDKDKYGLTVGGGQINNPGRYLVCCLPSMELQR